MEDGPTDEEIEAYEEQRRLQRDCQEQFGVMGLMAIIAGLGGLALWLKLSIYVWFSGQ